jgi:hypothetical protein
MMYENNYAGGGITTLPGYFWGGFLDKLSKVAGVASAIPGPHQVFAAPVAAASGWGANRINSRSLKSATPQVTKGQGSGGFTGHLQSAANFLSNPLISALAIPTAAAGIRALRGNRQQQPQFMPQYSPMASMANPYAGGFGMGMPAPYQNFLESMQSMYGFPGQYTPMRQSTYNQPMQGGSPNRGSYGGDSSGGSGSQLGRESNAPGMNMYAEGGMVDIPFEGFIPPTEDGMPESSGAVDDRVGLTKPDISEVSADIMEMLQMLKEALMNMEENWAQEIILLAVENFGEEFVVRLAEELAASDGNLPEEVESDRMVEMQFKQNLANGGPVKIGAAIAPNEYVLTARQVRKVGGGDAKEGAQRLKGLASMLDNMDTQKPLELSAQ